MIGTTSANLDLRNNRQQNQNEVLDQIAQRVAILKQQLRKKLETYLKSEEEVQRKI